MIEPGTTAPDFTVPEAGGAAYNDLETFTLSEAVADGPVVLAFYPAAFTSGCTEEMCAFRDAMPDFAALDAQVYGISVDLPFAQNVWIQQEELNFSMLSDWRHEVIYDYDVVLPDMYGSIEVAQRAVFVIDSDQEIRYAWERTDENPEFEPFVEEIAAEVDAIV